MIDREKLIERAKTYVKAHPPNTGDTIRAMTAVATADFPKGTNLMIQFALQFDGAKTKQDAIAWDADRLPYGDSRSLDFKSDCSSFWENIYDIFGFGDIGTWTEGQWAKWKHHQVEWEDRRPGDLVYYNFKRGRTVSHVAGYIGGGYILHTTGAKNPLRVEKDSYAKRSRVGVIRILTDEQYASLLVEGAGSGGGVPDYTAYPKLHFKRYNDGYVKIAQRALNHYGYNLEVDGDFGKLTLKAVRDFQKKHDLRADGIIGKYTWGALAA